MTKPTKCVTIYKIAGTFLIVSFDAEKILSNSDQPNHVTTDK